MVSNFDLIFMVIWWVGNRVILLLFSNSFCIVISELYFIMFWGGVKLWVWKNWLNMVCVGVFWWGVIYWYCVRLVWVIGWVKSLVVGCFIWVIIFRLLLNKWCCLILLFGEGICSVFIIILSWLCSSVLSCFLYGLLIIFIFILG